MLFDNSCFLFSSGLFRDFRFWFCSFLRFLVSFSFFSRVLRLNYFWGIIRCMRLNYFSSLAIVLCDLLLFVLIFDESDSFIFSTRCVSCFHELLYNLQVVDLLVHAASLKELLPADRAIFILSFAQAEDLAVDFLVSGKHSDKVPYLW